MGARMSFINRAGVISSATLRGAFGSRPAAGTAGRVYITTDGSNSFYDDGAAWQPLGFHSQFKSPPAVASFTAIQAGGRATTFSDSKGGLLLSMTNGLNGADDFRLIKVANALLAYTFTAHVRPMLQDENYRDRKSVV